MAGTCADLRCAHPCCPREPGRGGATLRTGRGQTHRVCVDGTRGLRRRRDRSGGSGTKAHRQVLTAHDSMLGAWVLGSPVESTALSWRAGDVGTRCGGVRKESWEVSTSAGSVCVTAVVDPHDDDLPACLVGAVEHPVGAPSRWWTWITSRGDPRRDLNHARCHHGQALGPDDGRPRTLHHGRSFRRRSRALAGGPVARAISTAGGNSARRPSDPSGRPPELQ